jgi:hypothetical protein
MAQFDALGGNNFIKQITSVKSLKSKPASGHVREMFGRAPKVKFDIDQRHCSPGIIAVLAIPRIKASFLLIQCCHSGSPFFRYLLHARPVQQSFKPCLDIRVLCCGIKRITNGLVYTLLPCNKGNICIGAFVTDEILMPY